MVGRGGGGAGLGLVEGRLKGREGCEDIGSVIVSNGRGGRTSGGRMCDGEGRRT